MPMTRSGNPSRAGSPVRRGASPVRRGASPVRRGGGDDDRSPSPSITLRKSRGRMQTPSAATKSQAATKSDSPPSGRTIIDQLHVLLHMAVRLRLLLTMSNLLLLLLCSLSAT